MFEITVCIVEKRMRLRLRCELIVSVNFCLIYSCNFLRATSLFIITDYYVAVAVTVAESSVVDSELAGSSDFGS